MHQLEAEKASMRIKDEETIKEYWDLRKQLDVYASNVKEIINLPNYALPYMQPGRLIKIRYMDYDFGWGVVVNFRKRYPHRSQLPGMKQQELYVIDALLHLAEDSASSGTGPTSDLPPGVRPPAPGVQGRMEVVPIILSCVDSIATVRLHLPKDLRNADERQSVLRSVQEVKRRFPPQGIPLLDPIEDMHIRDEGFKSLLRVRIRGRATEDVFADQVCCRKLKSSIRDCSRTHFTTRRSYQKHSINMPKKSSFKRRSKA